MGESTQGYGGTALLQGGADPDLAKELVLARAKASEEFRAALRRVTEGDPAAARIESFPYRYLAIDEADLKREAKKQRLLAGVNYRMQFFREAV